ncbi:hypothetical protein DRO54_02715 [Candidatus Bathyarchaeota archaeon]|nr:MAG: hypothetical protein DRO54_02715 [Candidatus Bathyarchaeota archaeon]
MKVEVEAGKTLLVDGPASVDLLSGKAEVLAAPIKRGNRIVVRHGKRLPFEIKSNATFEIMLGEGASYEEVEGSTIPENWVKAVNEIISEAKSNTPLTVMIMGEVDSGKTSFCTYLANVAIREKLRVAVIDGDLGQSDIGPPSTIGYSILNKCVKDLFDVDADNACFIGLTSPGTATTKVIEGLSKLKEEVERKEAQLIIINTDGWVEGEDAASYKLRLVETLKPHIVVGLQQSDELLHILSGIGNAKVYTVDSPSAIKKRDREKRKILRELSYKKYLRGAKIQSFLISWINLEGTLLGKGITPSRERMRQIESILGVKPWYCEETQKTLIIVLGRNKWVPEENLKKLEEAIKKRIKVFREGEESGLIVSLKDINGRFLGIGILQGIDYRRRAIKIYTPVEKGIHTVRIGQVKLDREGKELGVCTVFTE